MGTCGDYDTYQEQDEQVSKKWRPELIQDEMKQKKQDWWHITLWLCQNSYWKWWFIVELPIKNGGSFHSFLYVYQAGYPRWNQPVTDVQLLHNSNPESQSALQRPKFALHQWRVARTIHQAHPTFHQGPSSWTSNFIDILETYFKSPNAHPNSTNQDSTESM